MLLAVGAAGLKFKPKGSLLVVALAVFLPGGGSSKPPAGRLILFWILGLSLSLLSAVLPPKLILIVWPCYKQERREIHFISNQKD